MKTIWRFSIRSIRSSKFISIHQTRVFLQPVVVARPLSQTFSAAPVPSIETSEMAPKFELKTPKGTKDCESPHDPILFAYKILRLLLNREMNNF